MNTRDLILQLQSQVSAQAHLCLDSRQVCPGDVFFAVSGSQTSGSQYIVNAIEQGAGAVVVAPDSALPANLPVPVLVCPNLSEKLGEIADLWYGSPSASVTVIAVTGTNGKTSTVHWLAHALNQGGVPCGIVGTLGVTLPSGARLEGSLTTPDVLSMHRALAAIRDDGGRMAALEASSIGIDQGRLAGVRIELAAFTNLTHDHLDYHGTIERYKQAKMALFNWPTLKHVVVNADDPVGREILATTQAPNAVAYGLQSDELAAVRAADVQTGQHGLVFNLLLAHGEAQVVTCLFGLHNVSNLLLVAGVLEQLGWPPVRIAGALGCLQPVDGRLQVVAPPTEVDGGAPLVIVDYSHTPDALERALAALRPVAQVRGGRLLCVFGCGGNRDTAKRPLMGEVAGRLADKVLLTTDNPRDEDPAAILAQVRAGMKGPALIIPDRAEAILEAVWSASSNDVVLLAGKGHETYQEVQGKRLPFDDREWARCALLMLAEPTLSTDTRALQPGQVFLALKGESFDGHDYVAKAAESGAVAALVSAAQPNLPVRQIVLGDTRAALMRMGRAWRRRFNLPAIAVTGSNGKTTTKEMIAAILDAWQGEAALATAGNYNNDIGVPLTLLRLRHHHRAAVFELGMNHPGEIAVLAAMAQPTVALVNNAQREHQEFMQSVDAVAQENGAVLQALPDDGIAVFPGDDIYTGLWESMAGSRRKICFGLTPALPVNAVQIVTEATQTRFQLRCQSAAVDVTLHAPGLHNLRNALAAAACALAAGVPLASVAQGLSAFSPVSGRMQPHVLENGFQLIDDTYNANPDSVRAAIDVLASLKGPTVLVLGAMAEVGDNGPAMHAEVGAYASTQHVDHLLSLGTNAAECSRAFGDGARHFENIDDLVEHLAGLMPAHVLVKGSRSSRMERVVKAFQQLQSQAGGEHHAA